MSTIEVAAPPPRQDGLGGFAARVTVICTAIVVASGVVSWVWSQATSPIMAAVADERRARIASEERFADRFESFSRDRLDLLNIMAATTTHDRVVLIAETRRRWAREDLERERKERLPVP